MSGGNSATDCVCIGQQRLGTTDGPARSFNDTATVPQ